MKIAWVTDSTVCLDEELSSHPDLYVLPMTILLDEEEYLDGVTLGPVELYEKLKGLKNAPKSSQPSVGSFVELYSKLKDEYDSIISIHVSSHLSGTYSTAVQAANMIDHPIKVIDSKILSYPLSYLIKLGMKVISDGGSSEEAVEVIGDLLKSNETYVLVGSIEQLHRSGRMNGLQFFIGSFMNIKPIISISDGQLLVKEKVRSGKKGLEKMADYIKDSSDKGAIKEIFILYGLHDEEALKWKNNIKVMFPVVKCSIHPLGAVIGLHAGEHTLGISWFCES
ncbi:DegV family protein [Falsibacillus pallidus]|uniref:DegV family protein with EDD domain n=1 Tax=Falsibacillus pallidus TaxID=493781 RepID=A0A370GL17_9BACI|nr:DegV family protein [Falsibacillus pallidus]RDI43064.1 DegV family protein with EDD domain [Falsibacillus pallidus]